MLYFFSSCFFLCVLFFFVSKLFPKLKGTDQEKPVSDNDIAPKTLKHVDEETVSDKNTPQIKYDVFVSFRGGDSRRGFLSHLIEAFKRKQINAFVDDKLKSGDEIWPSLVKAIQESSISLILFSPDYISSRWCLEELVMILECKDKYGQIVIPVFYDVEPTNVGNSSSQSYKAAFSKHQTRYESKKVQIWRDALKISAKISGIVSSMFRTDDELLTKIIERLLEKLDKQLVNSKRLVGTEKRIEELESLICKEPESTRFIGIWGMGGIGKTTLAEELFNKLQYKFQGSYFLANERERSSRDGLISLKKEIFAKLLGHDVKIDTPNSLPNNRVRRMKVFIVLDDVNDSSHLEELLGSLDDFGSGSRIMITTRDEQVLNANNVDDVYQLGELNFDEALKLFKLNAFNNGDHQSEYDELSERMVNYAKGIPLVLKVLARRLRRKNKEVWESELDKLNKIPLPKVYDIMKLSYDDLDRKEQQIFLDLACFFLRSEIEIEVGHLKLLLREDENDNSVVVGLERLKDKALITFSEDNCVSIHDSLQEMACEIVRRESTEEPEKRSRLWDFHEIDQVLKNDKGTESIRSILLHLPTVKKRKLRHLIFAKMSKLRFLEVNVADDVHIWNLVINPRLHEHQKAGTVEVPKILATDELRFLNLTEYPLNSLPENFSGKKLVVLKLQYGEMKKLWNGVKNLVNLKQLDLCHSKKLEELPDLSKAINLEVILLSGCYKLTSVHQSVFSLPKLETLDLQKCKSLTVLTSNSHFCSLSYIDVSGCRNLTEFSVVSENLEELKLIDMKFKALPSSFGDQSKLKLLTIESCDIERLPSSFRSLTHLKLTQCDKLQKLPELPSSLETLRVHGCSSLMDLSKLPMSLRTLEVSFCYAVLTIPELPPSLEILAVCDCFSLETLPELPMSLRTLNASSSASLLTITELPPSLETLVVSSYYSLMNLPELPLSLETLNISVCNSLQTLPELPPSLKTLGVSYCNSLLTLPELPLSLVTLHIKDCHSLLTLPELPMSLKTLYLDCCDSLLTLPKLPLSLATLHISYCNSLLTLPELPLSLVTLHIKDCHSLLTLPELPMSLKTLYLDCCDSLLTLPKLPLSLEGLYSGDCKLLKTVLFPSTAAEQIKENRKSVCLWNCLKLNKKSLAAIGLNAQINLMKYADRHLSTPNHHHLQYHESDPEYQGVYMYPGRSVPEWLEYKTRNDYIIMDLSSAPPSSRLGFIFCFVLNDKAGGGLTLGINITDGEGIDESFLMCLEWFREVQSSDQICVVYDQRCSDFLNYTAKNQTSFKIQVTWLSENYYSDDDYSYSNDSADQQAMRQLKEFGVSPINSSTYDSFKQQMRFRDSLSDDQIHDSLSQFH